LKYSLHSKELNNWKARITERVVELYIQEKVISRLKKEGWSDAIYTRGWFYQPIKDHKGDLLDLFEKREAKFFIANNLFPISRFLKNFEKLTKLLKNIPDGFLVKWKETGRFKILRDGLVEFGLDSYKNGGSWNFGENNRFLSPEHNMNERLSVVDGEVEVIEVKSGKSNLPPHQKRSYNNIIREGYVLRFFQVNIVSFERNEFEIEQKLFLGPTELKSFPLKKS